MAEKESSLRSLLERSQDYLETRLEITKLKTIDKSADVIATVVAIILVMFVAVLALFFISTALALLLGYLLGRMHYGFFIMGGFYLILVIALYANRDRWVRIPLINVLIKKLAN